MSSENKAWIYSMLVIAVFAFIIALYVLGAAIGTMFKLGSFSLSITQLGIICGGITSVSVFVRCVKQLKTSDKTA